MKVIDSLEKTVYKISDKFDMVSGVALVAMMGLISINVILRAVWRPMLGTYEITALLAAVTIALAIANCAAKKGHIALTLFVDKLPRRIRAVVTFFISILGTGLFLVLAWEETKYGLHMRNIGEVGLTTELPFYPFIFLVAFGFLMIALVLFVDILKSLQRIFSR